MSKTKWIPKDMEWFLADMIQELKVAGAEDSTVWINTHLIRASSPDEAYEKALNRGKLYEDSWTNTSGSRSSHNLEDFVTCFWFTKSLKTARRLCGKSKKTSANKAFKK
ncbi:DUF4288 domain-containing protein [Tunturiibacter gelidoferens]|uniref:DUF4288 domain-containing protein n=1 Tax=Tunturiibacter gelidiferens TaxID=3069689 RepID=A0AAU7YWA9_9BACT